MVLRYLQIACVGGAIGVLLSAYIDGLLPLIIGGSIASIIDSWSYDAPVD